MSSSFLTLVSPIKGIVVPLAEVPDPVFAEGALGQGIALDLSGTVCMPPLPVKSSSVLARTTPLPCEATRGSKC
ncbi:PTS glucose transporter subunit IIA [Cobetia crustatorum]|uniref:PTS glucose transporter subunit IIA n=1 Tax=Cobetia crustatorum TaxID=553385 RepID=UPI000467F3BE|nr:PTS glucose transporter subunit IIA [Cobetia crustatorum]